MRTTGRPAGDKSFAHLRRSRRFKRGQESVWPAAAVSQTPPLLLLPPQRRDKIGQGSTSVLSRNISQGSGRLPRWLG